MNCCGKVKRVGLFLMYSVEDRKSLDNIGQFIKSYENNFPDMKKTMILVGNKCDSDKKVISLEEGKEMAEKS